MNSADAIANFSVFSKDADLVELLLFDDAEATEATETIPLDPRLHRTYHYGHTFVPGRGAGQVYAYRAHGPFAPERGLRFDSDKVLLDPYARAVAVPDSYTRTAASRPGDNLHGILNAYWEPLTFALPSVVDGQRWRRCIDTAQASADDVRPLEEAPFATGSSIVAQPRSIVVLGQIVHDVLGAVR